MANYPNPDNNPEQLPERPKKGKTFSIIIGMSVGLSALIIFLLILNYFKLISLTTLLPTKSNTTTTIAPAKDIIAKVGSEYLYQKDLETELSYGPPNVTDEIKKQLTAKIIKDSIILQEAEKEGLVKLDNTVFNSPTKDYLKRIGLVASIRKKIEDKRALTSGSVISLWFYNNQPASIGYDKGKQIAYDTITQLHDAVAAKQLTMQQAAEQIKNNSSLYQLDKAYKTNAIMEFTSTPQDKITINPEFNTIIRNLNVGDVSPVFLAQDKELNTEGIPTGKKIDAVYMFAQVTDKKSGASYATFEDWYNGIKQNYAITYY